MVFQRISAKNGLLSYENPNYHLDPSRLDDALNSNTDELYEELYQELDDICNMGTGMKAPLSSGPGRKGYASLDIGSMGVDITTGPVTNIDSSNYTDNRRREYFAAALDRGLLLGEKLRQSLCWRHRFVRRTVGQIQDKPESVIFNYTLLSVVANKNDYGNLMNMFELKFTNREMLSEFHEDNLLWCRNNLQIYQSISSADKVSKRSINTANMETVHPDAELLLMQEKIQSYQDEVADLEKQLASILNQTVIDGNVYIDTLRFHNTPTYLESLTTDTINGVNISEFLSNVIKITEDLEAESLRFEDLTLVSIENLKTINSHPLTDLVTVDSDPTDLIVEGDIVFQNGLLLDGKLHGITFTKENILLKEGNQSLSDFGLSLLSAEMLDADFINDIDVSQIDSFTGGIVENVDTMNVKSVSIKGLINSVDIVKLNESALKTFGNQTVTAKYRFDVLHVDSLDTTLLSGKVIPDELILVNDGDYQLNQTVKFTSSITSDSVFVQHNLNNIDVVRGKLDVLLTNSDTLQEITGFKQFVDVELSSSITLLGKINSSKIEAMSPVRTFNQEITLTGDYFINSEVSVEEMLQASDIQNGPGTHSVTKVYKEGVSVAADKIPVHLEFSQQLHVQQVFCDTINGLVVDSFVVEGLNEPQIIRGWKTFPGDVFITGSTELINANGVNMASLEAGVLTTNGNQTLTGNIHIENVYASRVNNIKTELGNRPWQDVINMLDGPVIGGTTTLRDALEIERLEADNIFCNSLINGYNFTLMVEDSIFRTQSLKLNGVTHFYTLVVENITAKNIDLDLVPDIIEDSKAIFEYTEDLHLNSELNVESITFTNYFNGISRDNFGRWLLNSDELYFNSDQTFQKVTIFGNLYVLSGFLDDVNITMLSENSVKINEPNEFLTITLNNGLASNSPIVLNGQFESLDLGDIVLSNTRENQLILDEITFHEDVTINGELVFNGLISGFNLGQFCRSFDDLRGKSHKRLKVNGNVYFAKGPKINLINDHSLKQLLDSAWLKNQNASISGVLEFDTIIFEDDLSVDGYVDDVKVQLLAQTYFSKSRDQNITARYTFEDRVWLEGGISAPMAKVKGSVGGINLAEFMNTALLNNYEQVFENILYLDDCEIHELRGEYSVNGLNLQNDVMLYSRNNIVTGKKVIRDVRSYVVKTDNEIFIQDVQLIPWIMNSVLKTGTFQLSGLVTFFNHTSFLRGISSQRTVNNINFNTETIMLRSTPQLVTAPKHFSDLKIKALQTTGMLNGVDMTDLISKQAYKNGNLLFQSPIYFNGSITTPNVQVEKLYQGINVTELLRNITHYASVNNYSEYFKKLLDVSYQIVDSLEDQAYYLNYYKVKQVYQLTDLIIPVVFDGEYVQLLACIEKGNNKYTTRFQIWDSNGEYFRPDERYPPFDRNKSLQYIEVIQFRGRDHWYMEHERTAHTSGNRYEGTLFKVTPSGLKEITTTILHGGTQSVTSLDLPMLNKCMLLLFINHGTIFCEDIGSRNGLNWEVFQEMQTFNSLGSATSVVNNVTHLFIINAGTLKEPANVNVWKYDEVISNFVPEQTIYVSQPTSISTILYQNCNFGAIASGSATNARDSGMITIIKYDEDKGYFVKFQDIAVSVPIHVKFAELPTKELVLYISTHNPTQPLIVYQYQGISKFVNKFVATTIHHSSVIKSFNAPDNRHFVLSTSRRETSVIEAVFKGKKMM
ncbi:uncharacterized protein LOC116168016 [Photinus pyralis]|nr:uncharacterized protein LOC116168016 [Photinus pyralis]